jgi:hypothetical protein
MVRLINPEDWFLVVVMLAGVVTFPFIISCIALAFKIPLNKLFNKEIIIIFFQLLGIFFFSLLLMQVSVLSDGMGANLIYGRF